MFFLNKKNNITNKKNLFHNENLISILPQNQAQSKVQKIENKQDQDEEKINFKQEFAENIKFKIDTTSVKSNNPERDEKIKTIFFGSMKDSREITGDFRNFKFNTDNLIPQRHIQYLNNLKKQNLIVGISIPQNVMTEKHQQIKYIKDKLITFKKE